MNTTRWFCIGLLVLLLPFLGKPPVADEESYLYMAASIADHPFSPYDWWRNWQPWGQAVQSNSFHFAHPPLHLWWICFWRNLVGEGALLRLCAGLPWVLLFGVSASKLAQRCTRTPGLGLGLALSSPVLLLGLHDNLMIDLGALSLCTAAVATYRCGLDEKQGLNPRHALWAGLLLGLAASYKYPSLIGIPLLLLHLWRLKLLGQSKRIWIGFGLVFLSVQFFLYLQYNEFHLISAMASASEIDRSPLLQRGAGMLVRLGFALCPLALLLRPQKPALLGLSLALGVACLLVLGRGDLGLPGSLFLVFLATAGAVFSLRAGQACFSLSAEGPQNPQNQDNLLLGAWALLVLFSILLGHNYADSRYLLPAILPLSLLLVRSAERACLGTSKLRIAAILWAGVALLSAWADFRLAQATDALANEIAQTQKAARFSAEWTARYRLRTQGWSFWHPSESLPPGDHVLIFSNAGSASPPKNGTITARFETKDHFPIRVLDWQADAGYHSEQLGRLPIAWGQGPLVSATLYTTP